MQEIYINIFKMRRYSCEGWRPVLLLHYKERRLLTLEVMAG